MPAPRRESVLGNPAAATKRAALSVRFLFLNQYFPPDPAPTGLLLGEVADDLAAHGHAVDFVSAGQKYRGAKKGGRALREVRGLLEILWLGLRAERPDVVVSATSPPLLLLVATLVSMRHGAKSAHWLFDMYPELAIALGEVREGRFTRFIESLMRWAYRRSDLIVALDADMQARVKNYGAESESIAPWVVAPMMEKQPQRVTKAMAPVWLYSGNLGRAHEWETLLEAQQLLEKRGSNWSLIFQGGGPSRPLAEARARELCLKNCSWKDYVPEAELQDSLRAAKVLMVTQRPQTQGLLWPSKLALIRTLPGRILFVGPPNGAIADELRRLPQAGIFAPGDAEKIADWLEDSPPMTPVISDAAAVRAAGLEKWRTLLLALGR